MARQASADRAWSAISRFYDNCKKNSTGKKGFPKFKKHRNHGSFEYKTTGWKLSPDRRTITFTDGFNAGSFTVGLSAARASYAGSEFQRPARGEFPHRLPQNVGNSRLALLPDRPDKASQGGKKSRWLLRSVLS